MKTNDATTEVFCGVARLPREMASAEPSSYLAIEIEVDMENGVVTDLAFAACPKLLESMVTSALLGRNPVDGVEEVRSMIEQRYHSVGKAAATVAVRNILQEYQRRRAAA